MTERIEGHGGELALEHQRPGAERSRPRSAIDAFINAAKSEAMNQTVRRNGNGIRA